MESRSERRRHARARRILTQSLRIEFEERPGDPRTELPAKLINSSADGFSVELASALAVGSLVFVDGQVVRAPQPGLWSARVTWCGVKPQGGYKAGLHLEGLENTHKAKPADHAPAMDTFMQDHYEVLQLSTKADPETIHRVFRMLAQRHHPDNPETGDADVFKRLLEAYRVLSDPERRASFDAQYTAAQRTRWRIFDQPQAAQDRDGERRKRQGILSLLYTKRLNALAQPSLTIHELEDLLACPREHLEFSLWYLKEKGWVSRTDNGRYSITAGGVEQAEATEIAWRPEDRLLSAPAIADN